MRFFKLDLLVGASVILAAIAALACSSQGDDCEANKSCGAGTGSGGAGGSGASGGTGASGGLGGDGGGCDLSKSPTEEACLVSDQYAVFVSPTGTAGAEGTKAAPLNSITEAVTKAAGSKVIVVCNGTYDEHVLVNAGAKIYGGFDCATWASTAGMKPKVAPTDVGFALELDSGTDEVVVENIEFVAKNGTPTAVSSIAAFVRGSANVTLKHSKLVAGDGVTGSNAVVPNYTMPSTGDLVGTTSKGSGGITPEFTCPAGDKTGGGSGGNPGGTGQDGGEGSPALGGGLGGTKGGTCTNGAGKDGNPGGNGADAVPITSLGLLTVGGWTPQAGGNGEPGKVGQGGGGGASNSAFGGGGGGNGGCGGVGANGGKGGGASIALLTLDSPVLIQDSELVAANAGDGGAGDAGQVGMATGGAGGLPSGAGACSGGFGGGGGNGGASGGGAGGLSLGIGYKGAKPQATTTSIVTGIAGNKGVGGLAGGNDGIDGTKKDDLELP